MPKNVKMLENSLFSPRQIHSIFFTIFIQNDAKQLISIGTRLTPALYGRKLNMTKKILLSALAAVCFSLPAPNDNKQLEIVLDTLSEVNGKSINAALSKVFETRKKPQSQHATTAASKAFAWSNKTTRTEIANKDLVTMAQKADFSHDWTLLGETSHYNEIFPNLYVGNNSLVIKLLNNQLDHHLDYLGAYNMNKVPDLIIYVDSLERELADLKAGGDVSVEIQHANETLKELPQYTYSPQIKHNRFNDAVDFYHLPPASAGARDQSQQKKLLFTQIYSALTANKCVVICCNAGITHSAAFLFSFLYEQAYARNTHVNAFNILNWMGLKRPSISIASNAMRDALRFYNNHYGWQPTLATDVTIAARPQEPLTPSTAGIGCGAGRPEPKTHDSGHINPEELKQCAHDIIHHELEAFRKKREENGVRDVADERLIKYVIELPETAAADSLSNIATFLSENHVISGLYWGNSTALEGVLTGKPFKERLSTDLINRLAEDLPGFQGANKENILAILTKLGVGAPLTELPKTFITLAHHGSYPESYKTDTVQTYGLPRSDGQPMTEQYYCPLPEVKDRYKSGRAAMQNFIATDAELQAYGDKTCLATFLENQDTIFALLDKGVVLGDDHRILLHCNSGLHRSLTAFIAYMKSRCPEISVFTIWSYLLSKRPGAISFKHVLPVNLFRESIGGSNEFLRAFLVHTCGKPFVQDPIGASALPEAAASRRELEPQGFSLSRRPPRKTSWQEAAFREIFVDFTLRAPGAQFHLPDITNNQYEEIAATQDHKFSIYSKKEEIPQHSKILDNLYIGNSSLTIDLINNAYSDDDLSKYGLQRRPSLIICLTNFEEDEEKLGPVYGTREVGEAKHKIRSYWGKISETSVKKGMVNGITLLHSSSFPKDLKNASGTTLKSNLLYLFSELSACLDRGEVAVIECGDGINASAAFCLAFLHEHISKNKKTLSMHETLLSQDEQERCMDGTALSMYAIFNFIGLSRPCVAPCTLLGSFVTHITKIGNFSC